MKQNVRPVKISRFKNGIEYSHWRVRIGPKLTGGKTLEKAFQTKEEAIGWLNTEQVKYRNEGTDTANILASNENRAELVRCLNRLSKLPHLVTLTEVVDFYIARMAPSGDRGLSEAVQEFIDDPDRQNQSRVYKNNVARELRTMAAAYASAKVHELSSADIAKCLKTSSEPKTFNNRRGQLSSFFVWAIRKKYCALNPVSDVPVRKLVRKLPGILLVDQVRELLWAAQKSKPDLIPSLTLSLFGCVRRAEAIRLTWDQVVNGCIRLDGSKAKTRSYRIIPLSENLTAWLELIRRPSGPVVPYSDLEQWPLSRQVDVSQFSRGELAEHHCNLVEGHRRRDLITDLGWKTWPDNCLRHSCASYSLLQKGIDENMLALALGHSTQVLHSRYKGLVTAKQAEAFFNIFPK